MTPPEGYRPHCLKPKDVPPACFCAWEAALRPTDLFDELKPAARWRPATIVKVRKGFGVYLHWLHWRDEGPRDGCPGRLVTLARARDYRETLAMIGCAPLTIYSRLQELHFAMRALAPRMDWSWLGQAAKRARRSARPVRQKLPRLQPVEKLKRLGLNLMTVAATEKGLTAFKRALMFRDGLMIATLAHRPLRLKNFAALALGTSLTFNGGAGSINFPGEDMKGRRPLLIPFPDPLADALQTYLVQYRPWLLSRPHMGLNANCEALWISNEGRAMAEVSISNMIKRRTKEAFGVDLSPHLFRDCVVTSVVRDAPASARLTRDLLGHTTLDMTNKHYNQALMIEASRRHTALMEALLSEGAEGLA
jgi:integrase/recombinase XerD